MGKWWSQFDTILIGTIYHLEGRPIGCGNPTKCLIFGTGPGILINGFRGAGFEPGMRFDF